MVYFDIRDAVAGIINEASVGVTAIAAAMPILDPAEVTNDLQCRVIATGLENSVGVRGGTAGIITIEATLCKAVRDVEEELPGLLEIQHNIAGLFRIANVIGYGDGESAEVQSLETDPLFDMDSLNSFGVFFSSVVIRIRAYRIYRKGS